MGMRLLRVIPAGLQSGFSPFTGQVIPFIPSVIPNLFVSLIQLGLYFTALLGDYATRKKEQASIFSD